ncbi:MAG: DNA gyrase subunit A [Cyanobacteria bacterium P01_A01_bin.37]
MAKQLNLMSSGQIVSTALHSEVQRSYLEYAMSVIVGRALPDVRDGLKPVHRRILYAMHELGLTPDRPFRKCARVVGDVLGKYHPHGDQAVYDALVRMVQDFSSRYPLLGGHGNFGSVDNDPPAAMRYTETRLAPISHDALLDEIGEATVDFIDNFDSSQQEPVVLPAQLPVLLLNGSSGIAVGMATNIPPHNLGEVVDGLIALIDNPTLSDDKLLKLIPGPDFPTGGEIINMKGVRDAHLTGRGSIPVRGLTQFEDIQTGRGRHRRTAIVITELPYQVNKAGCIEKIADLVNQGRLEGIVDIRDESDREGMRVVIELRRDAQPEHVLNNLYRLTPLQSNFGAILLALSDGQPRQLSLREMLQSFLSFREETLMRQYRYELEQQESRRHLVEGLRLALDNLDGIIDILRNAPDGTTAKVTMQEQFGVSDRQADAILSMPLRRLTGLERQKLDTEYDELTQRINILQQLLGDRREFLKVLKKDLRTLKKKFADPRRTRILSDAELEQEKERLEELAAVEAATAEEVVLEFTQQGYVRRSSPKSFQRRQIKHEEERSSTLTDMSDDDVVTYVETATTQQDLLVFTRSGKAYSVNVKDIPPTSRNSKGTPLIMLLPPSVHSSGDPDTIAAQILRPAEQDADALALVTQHGRIKRIALSEFTNLSARGLVTLKLKDADQLQHVMPIKSSDQLVVASSGGRMLRFKADDEQLPEMGRTAQGHMIMRLSKKEQLVTCVAIARATDEVFLVTTQGFVKRMSADELRLGKRGDIGIQAVRFTNKTDSLAGMVLAKPHSVSIILTDTDQVAYVPVDTVACSHSRQACPRLFKLQKNEKITRSLIAHTSNTTGAGQHGVAADNGDD